jgi:gamma-glutamyltranspeptidase/glutathione hydrolase
MPDTLCFPRAAVAAPHWLAAEAGRDILAQGGNAIEAMVAMAASIAVVYPHMNGIGGDGFWLVREAGGRVRGIEACGPAGELASIGRYRERGYAAIPPRGPHAMVTVAGAVGGWETALSWSAALGGRMPLPVLLARAIAQARDGVPVSASEARYAPALGDTLHAAPHFAAHFLDHEGRPWRRGDIRRQPALAGTLARLASAGLADFSRGDLAQAIAADLAALGAPITRADLAAYRAVERAPLRLRRRDATLFNFPPPTQGLAALLILGIFDRLGVAAGESVAHFHGLIEATKRAFAVRDRVVTDFGRLRHDPAWFLTPERLQAEAARIDMARAATAPLREDEGGTVWMGAIDAAGMAVSSIQSVYWEYGSGTVLPRTGILWQNRGVSFSLDAGAVNPLEPGRRPFHTLIPALAAFDDGRVMAYGAMGGDGQPQFQAQIYTRYADYGAGVAAAVSRPRLLYGRTWGAASVSVKVEEGLDPARAAALRAMGHDIEQLDAGRADSFGHAGMLVRHPDDGGVEAAHDPRSDGGALGV